MAAMISAVPKQPTMRNVSRGRGAQTVLAAGEISRFHLARRHVLDHLIGALLDFAGQLAGIGEENPMLPWDSAPRSPPKMTTRSGKTCACPETIH